MAVSQTMAKLMGTELSKQFTWTGKTSKGKTKQKLMDFKSILACVCGNIISDNLLVEFPQPILLWPVLSIRWDPPAAKIRSSDRLGNPQTYRRLAASQ